MVNLMNLKKPQYNYLIWNSILDKSRRRKRLSYHEAALDMLIEAQHSATEEGRRLLNPGTMAFHSSDFGEISADENAQVVDEANKGNSSSENRETDVPLDLLYPFGAKKILEKLTRDDVEKIKSFEIKETGIMARMKKHVTTLLLKSSLTPTETETMKLLLSSVINLVDNLIYTEMRHMLLTRQLSELEQNTIFDDITFGLDVPTLQLLDETVDKCHDLNTLLIRITTTMSELLIDNKRKSDSYKMLKVLDIVTEYMDKPINDQASELTFYRRFAMLLDFVFSDLDMTLNDGEIVAEATKIAQQQSMHNVTSCFSRKIDLLLRIKGLKVGLASNEWKSTQTKHMYIQQQSKNLRSNCSILNELFIRSNGKVNKLVAINFIANTISTLLLPTDITHLESFKKTVRVLFKWKDFLGETIYTLKKCMVDQQLSGVVRSSTPDSDIPVTPSVFFTLKSNRIKEVSFTERQEEQEEY
ncbi:hypothetical protein G6F56_007952 [Rhizopus delemar]|nr:hypothetical protein G6F56_007952 [Rhizopus delemar]